MGPERIFPNQSDELGEPPADWSGGEEEEGGAPPEEEEEEEEEEGEVQSGYQYQPLNQEPEEGAQPNIHQRLQAMRLHLPDLPSDSDDEEGDAASCAEPSSIPMDPEHVELVKRTMAAVKLPSLSVPVWAQQISESDWEHLVHQAIESRSEAPPSSKRGGESGPPNPAT